MLPATLRTDLGRFSPGGLIQPPLAAADALLYDEIARRRSKRRTSTSEQTFSRFSFAHATRMAAR